MINVTAKTICFNIIYQVTYCHQAQLHYHHLTLLTRH